MTKKLCSLILLKDISIPKILAKSLLAFGVVLIFLTLPKPAMAQDAEDSFGTPDGLPPALESVCDMESGAAYGLCNAYCEAMDCDSDSPNASDQACGMVAGKFTQVTGRPLPCEMQCPCAAKEAWNTFLDGESWDACWSPIDGKDGTVVIESNLAGPYLLSLDFGAGSGRIQCSTNKLKGGVSISITEEENAACQALLQSVAADRGIDCVPYP